MQDIDHREWLETDGLGGFASGTVSGERTRRYHGLLNVALTPPTNRSMLVSGLDAVLETESGDVALSTQYYNGDVRNPDGYTRLQAFETEPWPQWTWQCTDGTVITQELFMTHGSPLTCVRWRLESKAQNIQLRVCPFLAGRSHHELQKMNDVTNADAYIHNHHVIWRPNATLPAIVALSNGDYQHEPVWYKHFLYTAERDRGQDCTEDLLVPGTFHWNMEKGEAVLVLAPDGHEDLTHTGNRTPEDCVQALAEQEFKRRSQFASPLQRAADAYLVERAAGKTIIAGYPWFTDWGRDTFIALRGLCLATGKLAYAKDILLAWADTIERGMVPNRFVDHASEPEFNAADASLWYVIAVHECLDALHAQGLQDAKTEKTLQAAIQTILKRYKDGTRYHIRLDSDGLLACGEAGVQLTWMDAKVDDWVVTPRIGKPVEIQALWLNALWGAAQYDPQWTEHFERGLLSFRVRFWDEEKGYLADVIDVDHQPGTADWSFRPNQIFAVGGLPIALLEDKPAKQVVKLVEKQLLTPLGLRSLDPQDTNYKGVYTGDVLARDGAYHQGTVWPWLMGPFVEAWVRVRKNSAKAKAKAREKFVTPLIEHLDAAGIGHVSEIADGDKPHTPRGCPFQAWSVGELLRLTEVVLADE